MDRKLQMQGALRRYTKARRSRIFSSPSVYQQLISELLVALEDDTVAHDAVLAFTSAHYRSQQFAARAATIHAVATLEGQEWEQEIDTLLTDWLMQQAGLTDPDGVIAALADAVAREADYGRGLYVFARGILTMREGAEEGED